MRSPPRGLALALALWMPGVSLAQVAPPLGAPASGQGAALSKAMQLPSLTSSPAAAAAAMTGGQQVAARQAATQVAGLINPELPNELIKLEKQINALMKNAGAVQSAAKPVVQSGIKMVNTIESYPQQVTAFKTKYGIPQNPTLQQEVQGIGRYVKDQLGITPQQSAKVTSFVKSSPVFEQMKTPFQPANIMLAVGATAGINLISQMSSGEGIDLAKTVGFLGQGSFWGGLVGSGVGYGLAASVATMLIPGGAGLMPVLLPMFAGLAGSMVGWDLGSGLAEGKGLGDVIKNLDPATILGQAAGSTVGLLVGANVGAMIGGTLGSFAGPLGAVAGAVLVGQVGARLGNAVKTLFTRGDAGEVNKTLDDMAKTIQKIKNVEKGIADVKIPELPAASMASSSLAETLKAEYDQTYQELKKALEEGDKARAFLKLTYLQKLSARYQQMVGQSLRSLAAGQ